MRFVLLLFLDCQLCADRVFQGLNGSAGSLVVERDGGWSLISVLPGGGAPSNAVTRIISWREIAAEQPEAREAGG
jgi:hypothetical protein